MFELVIMTSVDPDNASGEIVLGHQTIESFIDVELTRADPIIACSERDDPGEDVDISLPLVMLAEEFVDRGEPVLDTTLVEALVRPKCLGRLARGEGVQGAEHKRARRADEETPVLVPHSDVLRPFSTRGETDEGGCAGREDI